MIGIRNQTNWYLDKAEQLKQKNALLNIDNIIKTVSEVMYVAALLEAVVKQQNEILNAVNNQHELMLNYGNRQKK